MNNPVTLFVIPFLLVQVQSATIPINVGQDGGEGLQDLSSRLYLAENPNFQNNIVGATLRKNLKKLCEQCKQSPICRGKEECEHCVRYCQPYGAESKGDDEASSMEEVGIAREPENDFTQGEGRRDMTLVSRSAGGEEMDLGGNLDRLQMIRTTMAEKTDQGTIVGNHHDVRGEREKENHQASRYYTVGVIKPGLLMNIMLKLINIKPTADMEKAVLLVKSRRPLPLTVDVEERIDVEFLKMIGRELETAERIHEKSPLDAEDINRILETAYEKGEFKSKTEGQMVGEAGPADTFGDEMVSSSDDLKSKTQTMRQNGDSQDSTPEMLQRDNSMEEDTKTRLEETNATDSDESLEENDKSRTFHHKKYKKKKKKQHMHSYASSYGSSYGSYNNHPYGYSRSNDDLSNNHEQPHPQIENQETIEALTGAQQESLRPHNEDRIGAKDEFQTDQKGFIYKGQGGFSKGPTQSQKVRNEEIETGSRNEDKIGSEGDTKKDQKKFSYKEQGDLHNDWPRSHDETLLEAKQGDEVTSDKDSTRTGEDFQRDSEVINDGMAQIHLSEQNKLLDPKKVSIAQPNEDSHDGMPDTFHTRIHAHFSKVQEYFNKKSGRTSGKSEPIVGMTESTNLKNSNDDTISSGIKMQIRNNGENSDSENESTGTDIPQIRSSGKAQGEISSEFESSDIKHEAMDDMPRVGMDFQPEDLVNLQMAKENGMKDKADKISKTGFIEPQDLIILQKKEENDGLNREIINSGTNAKTKAADNFDNEFSSVNTEGETFNEIDNNDDLKDFENPINKPQFMSGDKNLPGQTIIQVDDQLIDVPDQGKSIFQVNSQPLTISNNDNDQEQESIQINQPEIGGNEESENVGSIKVLPAGNLRKNPQIMTDQSGQNLGLAANGKDVSVAKKHPLVPSFVFQKEKEFRPPKIMYTRDEDKERSSLADMQAISNGEAEFPKPNTSPIRKNSFAPAFGGSQSPKIIHIGEQNSKRSSGAKQQEITNEEPILSTDDSSPINRNSFESTLVGSQSPKTVHLEEQGSERSSTGENQEMPNEELELPTADNSPKGNIEEQGSERSSTAVKPAVPEENPTNDISSVKENSIATVGKLGIPAPAQTDIVGNRRVEYANAIEERIEKLITPREQEFLHNFGKIVPAVEKMHLNSKSDIYFMGNGMKLPLKMSPNKDGTISLSVDLEKLCECRNSTCAHKMDMINKLDENLMDISNDFKNSEASATGKLENDNNIPLIENTTEKKIRKPRNHMDLSKLYKTYRKKYHKLHRRAISNEYFGRFKEVEQGLEKKLEELNENVKKSNREYNNMLRKGTKDLLQIKEEDQVVKQRIELVNDLLQWMKEMASEVTNVENPMSK
ncbi:uncharacterized protein LOC123311219 isoform X2 [Coccinella septempunctata]|uniref:uncharacterized protein LOC123311219 isoform X2 n=1 Tax=Coccinella septempunctata TaxID=41139 RepID=UPI001D07DC36|nr:uncharacterized protein LOC123311219 isoform X2 [Coccinella septempunctata]